MTIERVNELLDLGFSVEEINAIKNGVNPDTEIAQETLDNVSCALEKNIEEVKSDTSDVVEEVSEIEDLKNELKTLKELFNKKNILQSSQPEKKTVSDFLKKIIE